MSSGSTQKKGSKPNIPASRKLFNYRLRRAQDSNLICDTCGLFHQNETSLMLHKKIHAWEDDLAEKRFKTPAYECSICDLQTNSPRSLVFHFQEVHPAYEKVKTPKRKPASKYLYDENHNEISPPSPDHNYELLIGRVRCPLCDLPFTESRLKGHFMTEHPHEKSIFCTYCAAIITDELEMLNHLSVHNQGGYHFRCNVCKSLFVSVEAVEMHGRLHAGVRPFFCQICKKKYQSKLAAIAHFHSHLKTEMLRDREKTKITGDLVMAPPSRDLNIVGERTPPRVDIVDNNMDEEFINVWD